MSLSVYKKKRRFSKTPEPQGKKAPKKEDELLFVVQKHDASRLHYDFRLELRGALKSWAVPKGPSLNPADKRLAMLVEDHPYDYKDFEGIIPKGNYGAGTVIIWDQGYYTSLDPSLSKLEQEKKLLSDFHKGSMKFILHGQKIRGEYALVQTKGREENAWLLIKKNDRYSTEEDVTKKDKSVVSKKTIEQMAGSKTAKEWSSNRHAKGKLKPTNGQDEKTKAAKTVKKNFNELLKPLNGKKKSAYPKNFLPMLATLTEKPFDAEGWIYEIKWDGYRALAYLDNGKVELRSRNNKSFDQYYPIIQELKKWNIRAVIDGEIAVVNEKGAASFQHLQNWRSETDGELHYYVFDILWCDGYDLVNVELLKRRKLLEEIMIDSPIIRFSQDFETSGTELFEAANKLGLEGIIAKKNDSLYYPGIRTREWLKIKSGQRHEAIICGYTKNEDSTKLFSALVLGVYKNKKLEFIGQVGTGFTRAMQREILDKLKLLETSKSPFKETPIINKPTRFRPRPPKAQVTWVKPKLVCEVQYQELTSEGIMRHPSFQGLRTDKPAKKVEEEITVETPSGKLKTSLIQKKLSPPSRKRVKTIVNPHEQTQTKLINGHEVKFTNLKKIYWPKEKISKGDMINYYYQVLPYILPYMKDRPQSLNRHPNGINGQSFYQKNVASKIPTWLSTHDYKNITREGGKKFLVCTDDASLLYMANLGCIEMNPWHSRVQSPENPDWSVIDLDPDTNPFQQVIEAAQVIKKILDAADIPAYPKTSGSTGIHIYIPLGAKYDYEQSKILAELLVSLAYREMPGFTSLERNPAKRKGKIYLDFLQNRSIQTIAAPYSLRPKPGAPVSAPLHWDEIKKGLKIPDFTINNMPSRIKSEGDLFEPVLGKGIDLEKALEKINRVFS